VNRYRNASIWQLAARRLGLTPDFRPTREATTALGIANDLEGASAGGARLPVQSVDNFQHVARTSNPLTLQLSIHTLDTVIRELVPFFGLDCPVSVIYYRMPAHIPEPTEIVQATLDTIQQKPGYDPLTRSAFVLVGTRVHPSV
jgi:precorrin-4 methylase